MCHRVCRVSGPHDYVLCNQRGFPYQWNYDRRDERHFLRVLGFLAGDYVSKWVYNPLNPSGNNIAVFLYGGLDNITEITVIGSLFNLSIVIAVCVGMAVSMGISAAFKWRVKIPNWILSILCPPSIGTALHQSQPLLKMSHCYQLLLLYPTA